MKLYSYLKRLWWESDSIVVKFTGGGELGFNDSKGEMRYNLKKRGLTDEQIDSLTCECGEADSLENIVSVSKTPEKGIEANCKACFGL